jgi:hypothetical protein
LSLRNSRLMGILTCVWSWSWWCPQRKGQVKVSGCGSSFLLNLSSSSSYKFPSHDPHHGKSFRWNNTSAATGSGISLQVQNLYLQQKLVLKLLHVCFLSIKHTLWFKSHLKWRIHGTHWCGSFCLFLSSKFKVLFTGSGWRGA